MELAELNPDVTTNCRFCEEEFVYSPVRMRRLSKNAPKHKKHMKSKRTVCDKCRSDQKRVEKIKRFGVAAKDGPAISEMTRWQIEQDRQYNIFHKMKMIPPHPHVAISGSEWKMARPMAESECEHGRLPGDSCPSPRVEFTSPAFAGIVVQNWPHELPCECFGGL
jgi:hypothetical protein